MQVLHHTECCSYFRIDGLVPNTGVPPQVHVSLSYFRDNRWKIREATRATEELYGACTNVRVSVGDVEIDQHFFVQETSSHLVILSEPYITTSRMETKVLDNGSGYIRVKS